MQSTGVPATTRLTVDVRADVLCPWCHLGERRLDTALAAVAFAQAQLGKPYVWGGDGDSEGGFDCSDLTHAAYQAAGLTIPRTAQTQTPTRCSHPAPRCCPATWCSSAAATHDHPHRHRDLQHPHDQPPPGAVIRTDPIGHYLAATRPSQRTAA